MILPQLMGKLCAYWNRYGVPGSAAEAFEDAMRASLPHLFAVDQKLLYRLTTMLSPLVSNSVAALEAESFRFFKPKVCQCINLFSVKGSL